ncbi:MAG: hypothetical protein U1E48_08770 [Paracoccaceae bacterium]
MIGEQIYCARHRQRHFCSSSLARHRRQHPERRRPVPQLRREGVVSPSIILMVIATRGASSPSVVFMERALRKIHIQYPRRQAGMKVWRRVVQPPADRRSTWPA